VVLLWHPDGVRGLLFVCTANRARSALAELVARAELDRAPGGAGIDVASAGTWTPGGQPMWSPAAAEATRRGLRPDAFVSRPLSDQVVADAAVVLTATRALRDEVVSARPALLRRTFTWRELAWLFGAVTPDWHGLAPAERPAALPGYVARSRGQVPAPAGSDIDVEDPAGRPPEVMRVVADQTVHAVTVIVSGLCP
jgi:protein-tyrosine phosphatase